MGGRDADTPRLDERELGSLADTTVATESAAADGDHFL
jgi:hypothetical protein